MIKQKSIFDEPVKIRSRKEHAKTEEIVPFEDSIFAKKSKVISSPEQLVQKDDNDDEDTKYLIHDDEVPLEESIFAKHKKRVTTVSNVLSNDKKIDYEALFNKYEDLYTSEYILNTKRLYMIDSNMFNVCCMNLEESRKTKIMNIESYNIVKRIIKSVCTCIEDVFYSYTNLNATLINLVTEVDSSADTTTIYHILDRSYAEVIDEFGGKTWQKS